MKNAPYLGIIKDDEFLITTVKSDSENADSHISLQLSSFMKIYPHSKLRIGKIAKLDQNGWKEA
jgi:hypothetical protein